jgi:hypothetical protein
METKSPKDLIQEADRGRRDATPAIALTGVMLVVAVVVAVVLALAFLAYYVLR